MCYDNNARRPRTLSPRSTWPKISSPRLRCAPHIHIKSARPGAFGSLGRRGPWANHSVGVTSPADAGGGRGLHKHRTAVRATYLHYRYSHTGTGGGGKSGLRPDIYSRQKQIFTITRVLVLFTGLHAQYAYILNVLKICFREITTTSILQVH